MNDDDLPHAIYRIRNRRDELLYIGRSNDPLRRTNEHRLRKAWITSAVRIDLEWAPAELVHELERRAIEKEHPRYNVQHNRGRIHVEVSTDVPAPSGNGLLVMIAAAAVALLAARWGLESAANWSVRQRAARAGIAVELPPVRNPFSEDGPSWLRAVIITAIAASDPEAGFRCAAVRNRMPNEGHA